MNIEDIKALPVADIAEKDCALFLWVTFPCLLEGFEVIRAWGFTYKTVAFVWVKQNKKSDSLFWGMGYWTRSNVELCILATKGSPAWHSRLPVSSGQRREKTDTWREAALSFRGAWGIWWN